MSGLCGLVVIGRLGKNIGRLSTVQKPGTNPEAMSWELGWGRVQSVAGNICATHFEARHDLRTES